MIHNELMEIRTRFKIGQTVYIRDEEERGKIERIDIAVANGETTIEYVVKGVESQIKYDVEERRLGY